MDPSGDLCRKWKLLPPKRLAYNILNGMDKILLIDSRSFLEYNTSRIQQSVNLCCSKLVKRRLQHDRVHIGDLLTQTCHVDIEEYSEVIVYDQCTEVPEYLTDDNFLVILLRKLGSCTTFSGVSLLRGGYLAFHAMHPTLCENKANNSYKCTPLTSLSQPCLPVANIGPTRILPFLYLGSHRDAMSQETIQVNDISYILNVSTTCPKPPFIQEGHFYRIPVNDNYSAKLLPFFEQAFQFLDKVRETNGCVMVHCLAGISRSPTLAIAYVMRYLKMSSDDAYRYVKDKRPTISPNFNFLGQLLEYERMMKQEEENMKNRRDSGGSIGGDKPIPIIMDLQNCSPSSPVAKVTKPFVFEPIWTPRSAVVVTESKRDNNDNLPLLADADTWSDFSGQDKCIENATKLDLQSPSEFKVPLAMNVDTREIKRSTHHRRTELSKSETESPSTTIKSPSGFPSMDFESGAITPSGEHPPFPFGSLSTSEPKDSNLFNEQTRKSPSLSPKSTANRSFTLSLSPVTLPLEIQETNNIDYTRQESSSQERKRTLSMAMSKSPTKSSSLSRSPGKTSKPLNLTLSPVLSPGEQQENHPEKLFASSKFSSRLDKKSLVLPLSSPNTEKKSFNPSNKPIKSFTLSLSPVLSPDVSSPENIVESETFKCKEIVKETIKSFTLPLSANTSTEISQRKFAKSPRLPISPLISSDSDSSTLGFVSQSSSESTSPKKSPSKSFNLPGSPRLELDMSSRTVQMCVSGVTKEKAPHILPISPCLDESCISLSPSTTSGNSLSDLAASDTSSLNDNEIISTTLHSVLNSEKSKSMISTVCTTKSDSLSEKDKALNRTTLIPNSLALSHKKHLSQSLYSPSTALAQLHFSQTIPHTSESETFGGQSTLSHFPSTSLDKLNFTACRTHKLGLEDVEMTSISSPVPTVESLEPYSPMSISSTNSSTCSSTITSPSNISAKVILRSRENRTKRNLVRPNSIAFSKYPTFDLGSDCQESPSSGSSTSQDDSSEMYMLQNGKRTKHSESDDKFKMGKYSEREVYKQISAAMESAMFKTQVYEANRKARSLDDILSSETRETSVNSVLHKTSRHLGLGMERFGSPALYETFPYRCRGSSDPYQSNSSISSSGSHSSLHGSMEIIQVS